MSTMSCTDVEILGGHPVRQYESTHPWITFNHRLDIVAPLLWMQIGEIRSKCEHIARTPLRPDVQEELYMVYLAKGARGTAAIEGNTLSEDEVRRVAENDLQLPPSRQYQQQEIDNILAAYSLIHKDVVDGKPLDLTVDRVLEINKLMLTDLEHEDHVVPGEFRTVGVSVGHNYVGAPAEDCDYLVRKLCEWLREVEVAAASQPEEVRFASAFTSAVLAHLYLAWIHPFGDGNGRTARTIEFQLLLKAGVPAVAAHLLSDHYSITEDRYRQVLHRSSKERPYEVQTFLAYAVQGFVDGLRSQIERISSQHYEVTWRNFVHEQFADQKGDSAMRRQQVALELPPGSWTATASVRHLNPWISEMYAGRHDRTISRDLNVLEARGLIRKDASRHRVRPRLDVLRGFIPVRAEVQTAADQRD
ncbi:Fic family protein [Streptomyces sp. NPDC057474]|uniref:Fic family protein n=1 Tax=Streptomyces sp. NPDC057474 TaxID=3346144 RepID=UPI0036CEC9A4